MTSRAVFVVLAAALLVLLGARPAAAHIAGGAAPADARSTVTGIRPAAALGSHPPIEVTVGLGGQFVRVVNQHAGRVVVVGYRGEPFLRLSRQQVQINQRSVTARQTGLLPADAGTGRQWVRLAASDTVTWTDRRIDGRTLPPGVSRTWTLPIVVDGQRVTVLGTRTGLASPSPWPWAAALVLVAAAVAALGWKRDWHRPTAAVTVAAVVAFAGSMVGNAVTPQPAGAVTGWAVVAVLGAFLLLVAALTVVSTLRKDELAPSRLPMMAVTLLLLAGSDITGLWRAELAFAGPELLERGLIVAVYGIALGLLVAGVRLVRSTADVATAEEPSG